MRTRKKDQSPNVTIRKGALSPETDKIIELSTADGRATGCLVSVSAPRDGRALYIHAYRADADVYLEVRTCSSGCALRGGGRESSQRDVNAERCDCGGHLYYDHKTCEWKPTSKETYQ